MALARPSSRLEILALRYHNDWQLQEQHKATYPNDVKLSRTLGADAPSFRRVKGRKTISKDVNHDRRVGEVCGRGMLELCDVLEVEGRAKFPTDLVVKVRSGSSGSGTFSGSAASRPSGSACV